MGNKVLGSIVEKTIILCPDCKGFLTKESDMSPSDTLVCNHCKKGTKILYTIEYVTGFWDGYSEGLYQEMEDE